MVNFEPFADEIQELQTLPRAAVRFEGFVWYARVFPTWPGLDDTMRHIAILKIEQDFDVQDYMDRLQGRQQISLWACGIAETVDRRFIFRDIEAEALYYDIT